MENKTLKFEVDGLRRHAMMFTAGCSFTAPHQENQTWATILEKKLTLDGVTNTVFGYLEDKKYKNIVK